MPLLDRKRVVVAKIETTYGTDAAPTGAANAILVSNLQLTPMEATAVDRDVLRSFLGATEQVMAARYAKVTFDVELAGSGSLGVAPKWGPLMRACGFSETVVATTRVDYKSISSGFESATLWVNNDGVLHKMTGCRGTMKMDLTAKQIPKISFEFWGLFGAPVDGTIAGVAFTGWQTPLAVNNDNTSGFALHGTAAPLAKLAIDGGNSLVHRNIVGSESVLITDTAITGSVSMEAGLMATKNWFSIAEAATLGTLAITHGTVAGNVIGITSSRTQISAPKYSSTDGILMLDADLRFVPSSAGGDEITLIVK